MHRPCLTVMMWEYGLMLACSISALVAIRISTVLQWAVLVFWMGVYLFIVRFVAGQESPATTGNG